MSEPTPQTPPSDDSPFPDVRNHPLFPTGKRQCTGCRDVLDLEEFGDRRDGFCLKCAELRKKRIADERKEDEAMEAMELLLVKQGGDNGLPKVEELCGSIMGSFGGMPAFVAYWKAKLDQICDGPRGPTVGVLNQLAQIMKLIVVANQTVHQDRIDAMTFDQVDKAQKLLMAKMFFDATKDEKNNQALHEILDRAGLVAALPEPQPERVNGDES